MDVSIPAAVTVLPGEVYGAPRSRTEPHQGRARERRDDMRPLLVLLAAVTANDGGAPTRGHSGAHMVSPSAPTSPEGMIPSLSTA
ncbi:MAG: hypothetical protein EHM78_11140, partial [Myxococcaceae bacterium]